MYEEYLEHFPSSISEEIKQYAINEVFKFSRYIFTTRKGKQQYGYCTHCHKEFKTEGLRHNDKAICPKCKSGCTVKASGLGRKYMVDSVYFTYYEKSIKDTNSIIATGIYAKRDYSGDYRKIKTKYCIKAYYLFQPGESIMFEPVYYRGDYFQKSSRVHTLFGTYGSKSYIETIKYSRESIEKAVKNTPFQYSTWESYKCDDMVEFFDLYSKYPCIEYLTKTGFEDLVETKLYGNNTYSSINWRGKTIFKVLRLNKNNLKEIRESKVSINALILRLYQISIKDKSNLTLEEIRTIANSYGPYFGELQIVHKYTSLRKIDNYLNKQQDNYSKHFYSTSSVLHTWKDYISDCIKLDMGLSEVNVLFPKNIYSAHQNTIKQVKLKADEELNKKIAKRVKDIDKKYSFECNGLLIRAAKSSNELINEGKALNHCVGTYADSYANGQTNILVIRKNSDIEKPYYTMEIRNGEIIQTRGKRNCNPTEDVSKFIEAFKEAKLSKKSKNKMKKSA